MILTLNSSFSWLLEELQITDDNLTPFWFSLLISLVIYTMLQARVAGPLWYYAVCQILTMGTMAPSIGFHNAVIRTAFSFQISAEPSRVLPRMLKAHHVPAITFFLLREFSADRTFDVICWMMLLVETLLEILHLKLAADKHVLAFFVTFVAAVTVLELEIYVAIFWFLRALGQHFG